jgi:hypothetical protein
MSVAGGLNPYIGTSLRDLSDFFREFLEATL